MTEKTIGAPWADAPRTPKARRTIAARSTAPLLRTPAPAAAETRALYPSERGAGAKTWSFRKVSGKERAGDARQHPRPTGSEPSRAPPSQRALEIEQDACPRSPGSCATRAGWRGGARGWPTRLPAHDAA